VKVSESEHHHVHLDGVESDEPFHSKPVADHLLSTVKDATNSPSLQQDEAAVTKSHVYDVSYQQEIIDVDHVATSGEFDQNDVFVTCTAEAEPTEFSSRELRDITGHNKDEETENFVEVMGTACDREARVVDTADFETETTLSAVEKPASVVTSDVCSSGEIVDSDMCVDSVSDVAVSFAEPCTSVALAHSSVSDEQVDDGDKVDNTDYHNEDELRWSIEPPSDQLSLSQATVDLPCVPGIVSKSELSSAVESSSGLVDHCDGEQKVEVCSVCCLSANSAWKPAAACLSLALTF